MQNFREFFFRSFIYGLIEREKLITNIYILFRLDHYLTEKNAKKVKLLKMPYIWLHSTSFSETIMFQGYLIF